MQVVILCGGQGTRIRDVAEDVPKPMIPIGGRPILWHIMKGFARHGLKDFVLCLGYKSWAVKRYLLDYRLAGADFTVDLSGREGVRLHGASPGEDWRVTAVETGLDAMTGCRLKRVERYVTGDTFLLTYGDGVSDVDVGGLLAFHREHGKTATVTAVRPPGRFGELELEGPRVLSFDEKPSLSRGWINGGFFVLDRSFFGRLDDSPDLVLEGEPLARLARDGELAAYRHEGFWHPMDNSRDYNYLNALWSEGKAAWKTWDRPRPRAAA